MGVGNKATRARSIVFRSAPLEGPTNSDDFGLVHAEFPETTDYLIKTVPMTRPEKGDLTELYIFARMIAPTDRALSIRIGIGWLLTVGTPQTIYSAQHMLNQQRLITGAEDAFTATAGNALTFEANLLPAIPPRGDANFSSDLFVLLFEFNEGVDTANDFLFDELKVTGSAQIGLGT